MIIRSQENNVKLKKGVVGGKVVKVHKPGPKDNCHFNDTTFY